MCSAWESYFALRARLKVALLNPLMVLTRGSLGYLKTSLYITPNDEKILRCQAEYFLFFSHILHLKVVQWLYGGIADEVVRLLNVRQSGSEYSQQCAVHCLHLTRYTLRSSAHHNRQYFLLLLQMLAPARLAGSTASPRCCLA